MGTGHTVAAAGTSNFEILVDLFTHRINQAVIFLCEAADAGLVCSVYIFYNHLLGIHAGEDTGDLRLVPEPVKSPLCGSTFDRIL